MTHFLTDATYSLENTYMYKTHVFGIEKKTDRTANPTIMFSPKKQPEATSTYKPLSNFTNRNVWLFNNVCLIDKVAQP